MPTKAGTPEDITVHLARAKELDTELEEYAQVYDVDATKLKEAQAFLEKQKAVQLSADDFVKIDIANVKQQTGGLCRITHPTGWTLHCNEWPPAAWLQTLGSLSE